MARMSTLLLSRKLQQKLAKGRSRSRRKNLTYSQRQEVSAKTARKKEQIQADIAAFHTRRNAEITDLAKRWGISEEKVRERVQFLSHMKSPRKVNAHNAYIHVLSLVVNEGEPCDAEMNDLLTGLSLRP